MDLNALMGALLSSESISGVSQNTGASEQQVQSVLGSALPLLLNGANAQAQDEQSGFAGALQQHAANDTSNIASFLSGVDKIDGAKIVAHLLGANTQAQTQSVAAQTGVSPAQTGSILATAAPLLMSLMGQQTAAAQSSGNNAAVGGLLGSLLGNVDLGKLAMNLLGASPAQQQTTSTGKKKKKPAKKDEKKDEGGLDVASLLTNLLK
ncbi:MAG: DUF937 domain-containing protein [Clostridia bacterium]|nr:DUF937 domain-containing protein [Clostridia bacterium]